MIPIRSASSFALFLAFGLPTLAQAQARPTLTDPAAARQACEQAESDSYETDTTLPQQLVEYESERSGACLFLDPMAFGREDYTSVDSAEPLRREYAGWFYNQYSEEELICRVDVVASYARVATTPGTDVSPTEYSAACDAPELQRTKRQTVNFLRVPAGNVLNVSSLVADGRLSENNLTFPTWVRCAVGGAGVSCQDNPCRDEQKRYAALNTNFDTGEPGKPRSDGARCARMYCRAVAESGDVRAEPVSSGYFIDGACVPFAGCYHNRQDFPIGASRNEDAVLMQDSSSPAAARPNARCDIRRSATICKNPGPFWETQVPYLALRDGYWHKDTQTCEAGFDPQCYYGNKVYQPGTYEIGSGECRCGETFKKMLRCENGTATPYNSRPCPNRPMCP